VDHLDYYDILGTQRGATASSLRDAYHAAQRKFHPDGHRHLDGELREAVERISKRVTEAYSVLRDPRRRKLYDERIALGAKTVVRMQLVEATAEAGRRREERGGKTPNGRATTLAQNDLARGDLLAAARNLQMAVTFGSTNGCFQAEARRVRARSCATSALPARLRRVPDRRVAPKPASYSAARAIVDVRARGPPPASSSPAATRVRRRRGTQ
jgi:DnaJ-class molecular chaperone